jgi:ABC-type transporter MlaC component
MSQMNVELYFQWRQRQRHGNFEAADRSQIGIQVTKFF